MKTEIKADPQIVITLNCREARVLQSIVQNPLCHPYEESKEDKELRHGLFSALSFFTDANKDAFTSFPSEQNR